MLNFIDVASTKIDGKILTLQDGRLVEFDLGGWLRDNAKAMRDNESPAGLKIRILASASGMLINNRVYPGPEWKKSAKDFKDKPILKHHDGHQDAIGRIKSAEFKQMAHGNDFNRDKFNPRMQGKGDPTGLVYVDAVITDPDAIQKILDERLLHTSQGSRASGARCSICGSNWAEGNYCDHTPGRVYEDEDSGKKELCYWMIDGLMPKEVSVVNEPALGNSKIVSTDSLTDSQNDRFLDMLDEASKGTAVALGDHADRLLLTDSGGSVKDVRVVKEEKYEILDLSDHEDSGDTDNEPVEQSAGDEPVSKKEPSNMSDTAKEIKALEDEIKSLKDQNEELTSSNKELREKNEELSDELKDKKSTLETLQDTYNTLLEQVQGELIDSYIDVAGVAEDSVEQTRTNLEALDTDSLRFMVSEAKRLKKEGKSPIEDGVKPEGEGQEGETGKSEDEPKVTPKPRRRKSLRKGL